MRVDYENLKITKLCNVLATSADWYEVQCSYRCYSSVARVAHLYLRPPLSVTLLEFHKGV